MEQADDWPPQMVPARSCLQDNDFAGDGQKITLDECVEFTKGM